MLQDSNILIVFGNGGHAEQMSRLIRLLQEKHNINFIAITEEGTKIRDIKIPILKHLNVIPLRPKHSDFSKIIKAWRLFSSFIVTFFVSFRLLLGSRISLMISTGPGIALPIAIVARIFRIRVIHIETWSRFYTKSFTGRFMYHVANDFWIQNKELMDLYPKCRYIGRL